MKRIILICLVLLFVLSGCSNTVDDGTDSSFIEKTTAESYGVVTEDDEEESFIGSWLTYIEMQVTADKRQEEVYRNYIDGIFKNLSDIGVNNVFIHARPFADALYESGINVSSAYAAPGQGEKMYFDCFSIAVETAKKYNMKVHGWINPYRVSNSDSFEELCDENIAKKWWQEKSTDVCRVNGKIYFNPASLKVRELLISTVGELMEKYELDGIHIDDYFYPEDCGDFDSADYERYTQQGGKLSLQDFRRENVNAMVSSLNSKVKAYGEDKIFSVSPEAKIEKNRSEKYADVALWCKEDGYIDMIIPQIYYGFENETQPFENCLMQWKNICTNENVKLVPGLALYKSGQADEFAGESGKDEWINNNDIIKRQVTCIKNEECDGFSLYSSSYVNFNETFLSAQLNELKSVL